MFRRRLCMYSVDPARRSDGDRKLLHRVCLLFALRGELLCLYFFFPPVPFGGVKCTSLKDAFRCIYVYVARWTAAPSPLPHACEKTICGCFRCTKACAESMHTKQKRTMVACRLMKTKRMQPPGDCNNLPVATRPNVHTMVQDAELMILSATSGKRFERASGGSFPDLVSQSASQPSILVLSSELFLRGGRRLRREA